MTSHSLFTFALLVNFLANSSCAKDSDVIVLLQRTAGATEFYISARADVLFELMGDTPSMFVGPDDVVDFGTLRNGTSGAGDALLIRTHILIEEVDAGFEAMSLMVNEFSLK